MRGKYLNFTENRMWKIVIGEFVSPVTRCSCVRFESWHVTAVERREHLSGGDSAAEFLRMKLRNISQPCSHKAQQKRRHGASKAKRKSSLQWLFMSPQMVSHYNKHNHYVVHKIMRCHNWRNVPTPKTIQISRPRRCSTDVGYFCRFPIRCINFCVNFVFRSRAIN